MTDGEIRNDRGECGNALFLILIAVALFAALSYAITESGRGGGTIDKETVMITAGEVVQQPASVRTAMTRMIITGTPAASITYTGAASANDVFDTADGGGGATNIPPPTAACVTSTDCTNGWVYPGETDSTHGIFVAGVGTAAPELLAVLQGTGGVTLDVCNQINKGLGFTVTAPPVDTTTTVWTTITGTIQAWPVTASSASTVYDDGDGTPVLSGQDFACIRNGTAGVYAYYHTLVEQ
ncbi:MAG: hypothetical protein KGL10_02815 [Alphaproteobacteria bacterium]|nr:hypothetical protein [Alphaproteobacteria bacterium]